MKFHHSERESQQVCFDLPLRYCILWAICLFFLISCAPKQEIDTLGEITRIKERLNEMEKMNLEMEERQTGLENSISLLDDKVNDIEGSISELLVSLDTSGEIELPSEEVPEDPLSPETGKRFPAEKEIGPEQNVEGLIKEYDLLSPEKLYKKGYDHVIFGEYGDAIEVFQYFIRKHADNALVDNAQYWIGESYYVEKDYVNALSAFRKTVDMEGNKVPDALLKIGLTHISLGDRPKAEEALGVVMKEYPGTRAADIAGNKLNDLKKRGD